MIGKLRRLLNSFNRFASNVDVMTRAVDDLVTVSRFVDQNSRLVTQTLSSGAVSDLKPRENQTELMVRHRGMWMPLGESRFQNWMSETGDYQQEQYEMGLKHTQRRGVAVDVGANVGFFSKHLCRDFETVHAFEPVHPTRACLARNVPERNLIIYPYALSDSIGEPEIKYSRLACGGAQIGGTLPSGIGPEMLTQRVRLMMLDDLGIPSIDFLKLDVQGLEVQVLKGAEKTLARSKCTILCEVEVNGTRSDGAEEWLVSRGYTVAGRFKKDVVFVPAP